MRYLAWCKTDTGRKRDHNEDSFLIDPALELYAVADGMGGHRGGETASRLALEVVQRVVAESRDDFAEAAIRLRNELYQEYEGATVVSDADTLRDGEAATGAAGSEVARPPTAGSIVTAEVRSPQEPVAEVMSAAARKASSAIYDRALSQPSLHGMGTTLTAILFAGGRLHLVHAGDSRAYLFRDASMRQLTEDHSWTWEQVKAGIMTAEEAKLSRFRHIITRSVGFERDVHVDQSGLLVQAGDCVLLCSDGMSNHVENFELEQILRETWYSDVPTRLVELANERGGDDNITVVVIYVANQRPS
jgi:protein phosphatase